MLKTIQHRPSRQTYNLIFYITLCVALTSLNLYVFRVAAPTGTSTSGLPPFSPQRSSIARLRRLNQWYEWDHILQDLPGNFKQNDSIRTYPNLISPINANDPHWVALDDDSNWGQTIGELQPLKRQVRIGNGVRYMYTLI